MFWNTKSKVQQPTPVIPDAEIDIEGLPIASIERRIEDETIIEFWPPGTNWRAIECTVEQHNGFVRRFREKLRNAKAPNRY